MWQFIVPIYVNDFPNCTTSSESIMFADDTNIFLKYKSYEKLYLEANQQLSNIEKWLNCNKLAPNIKTTFYIVFRRRNTVPPPNSLTLSFKNNCITCKSEANFLGVIFNEFLSWKPHMDQVLRKTTINLGVVKKISPHLNKKSLNMLYHSMIVSHIRYYTTTWCLLLLLLL